MSTIGIIGAGAIGSAFARALAGKGLKAIISNSRGPESLADSRANSAPQSRRERANKRPRRTSSSLL
jgi:predicted dinucleotide-binding enzyme